jgi:hypothetical protein
MGGIRSGESCLCCGKELPMTALDTLGQSILALAAGALIAFHAAPAAAVCDYEPDAPDCTCFDDTGAWDPGGPTLQDVALDTLGTIESCQCPIASDPTCDWNDWESTPEHPRTTFDDSGKPYYQMQLGNDDPFAAFSAAILLAEGLVPDGTYPLRGAWCSEAVAYWHKHAFLPYPGGFRNDRHMDWQVTSARKIVNWYLTERSLREITDGDEGRGWFVFYHEIDFDDFQLGRTAPVPGAYIGTKGYAYTPYEHWLDWDQTGHSLIVDEMTVHRDGHGRVFQVELTVVQGNSSNQVRGGGWPDMNDVLPQGPTRVDGKKIFGFGIDLDAAGNPIYDASKLHYVDHPFVALIPPLVFLAVPDPDWDPLPIEKAAAYGHFLSEQGGPGLGTSSNLVQFDAVPDSAQNAWHFPQGLDEPVDVEIDLRTAHPELVTGLELRWQGSMVPTGYSVQFAGADHQYQAADVPDLANSSFPMDAGSVAVPVGFPSNGDGAEVRYVRLLFPAGVFADAGATLRELRFRYAPGTEVDAEANPGVVDEVLDCGEAVAVPACLWPPDHELVDVAIHGILDAAGNPITPTVFGVSSDEATASEKGAGGKRHAPDALGVGTDSLLLRAERSGRGDGRVYEVYFYGEEQGKLCQGHVPVKVPHARRSKGCLAVDSGQAHDASAVD